MRAWDMVRMGLVLGGVVWCFARRKGVVSECVGVYHGFQWWGRADFIYKLVWKVEPGGKLSGLGSWPGLGVTY